jgi:hypothetical protein
MACYQVAKQDEANAKTDYQCAIDDLRRGLELSAATGRAQGELQPYAQALLESIRERHDLSESATESAPYAELLRTQSALFRESHPDAPDGYYYGATAAFAEANRLLVQRTAPTTACRLLSEAQALVAKGDEHPGQYAANLEQTGRQIARSLQRECPP